jgi:hypothetical protein
MSSKPDPFLREGKGAAKHLVCCLDDDQEGGQLSPAGTRIAGALRDQLSPAAHAA